MFLLEIKILGSGREVGRGAIAVGDQENGYVVLDYGVNFDENDNPVMPLHIPPNKVRALVLTHTHLDHIGGAPLLYTSLEPPAFSTSFTRKASRLMLEDFLKLSGYYLDFELEEVNRLLSSIKDVKPGDENTIGPYRLKFYDSGHIPGSVSVLVEGPKGERVLYTSDISLQETKLVKGARLEGADARVIVIESTYGASDHPPRRQVEMRFVDAVLEVLENGGTVLVPVFSIGRGQEIMSVLIEKDVYPVFVDGMVRQATGLMLEEKRYVNRSDLLEKAREEYIFVQGWQDRRRIWRREGVIVASAGMLKGGPSRYYLKKIGGNPKNGVFMVSYQASNTPGRSILETGFFSEGRKVDARVEWFDFSSHAGSSELVRIIKSVKSVERVVLVHGEPSVQELFAKRISKELGIEVVIPSNGESLTIDN